MSDILERAIDNLRGEEWDNEADAVEELIAEIGRLRSEIMQPIETFGTPELVAWIEDMHRLVVDYPEPERGQIPFVMEMGELLTRGMKSWTADKDARIKELEASIRQLGSLAFMGNKPLDQIIAHFIAWGQSNYEYTERLEAAFLEAKQCPTCEGAGEIRDVVISQALGRVEVTRVCPLCEGRGEENARAALEKIKKRKG